MCSWNSLAQGTLYSNVFSFPWFDSVVVDFLAVLDSPSGIAPGAGSAFLIFVSFFVWVVAWGAPTDNPNKAQWVIPPLTRC